MPKVFPGINGCPGDGTPSFVVLDGLTPEWHHLVTQSRPLSRAINAATQIPTIEDEETRAVQFAQMDLAEQASLNVVEMIRRVRQWSQDNLQTDDSKHAKSSHAHAHKATETPTHATKSHG